MVTSFTYMSQPETFFGLSKWTDHTDLWCVVQM